MNEAAPGGKEMIMRARTYWLFAVAMVAIWAFGAAPASADVTIGDDVNNTALTTQGTCQGNAGAACVIVSAAVTQGGPLASPCDGTVTRFRINGVGPTSATYRLRILHLSGTTATAVSASAAVPLAIDGVNTFPAGLPIHTGDQLGLEFTQPVAFMSVRYRPAGGTSYGYLDGIPDSGSASTPSNGTTEYLVNADVACGTGGQGGPSATTPKCRKKKHKREASAAKKKRCKKKGKK